MRTSLAIPLAASAVLTALLRPTAAGATDPPFTATFAGSAAIAGPSTTAFVGSGHATHLGRISTDGDAQITGLVDTPCINGVANINTEVFTAANDDTLTVVSDDVACPIAPNQPRYHGTGSWHVDSGTGRFAGASGTGTFDGQSDFAAGTFNVTLTGTLTLRASD